MANILSRYGIKEVADVTFYDITETGERGAPVLFLDTLKVSTIEQTGEQAEARGGKGNAPLIIWDYGKEINVTLEDALFSAKSMSIMFGNGNVKDLGTNKIMKTINCVVKETLATEAVAKTWTAPGVTSEIKITDGDVYNAEGKKVGKLTSSKYSVEGSETQPAKGEAYFITFEVKTKDVSVIDISANSFPGTYYVTGDTYVRSEVTGDDESFQFIIQKAKVQSENTITLEAEGDPSVFNMSLRVLRPADGIMMKLVKYTIDTSSEAAASTTDGKTGEKTV